MGTVQERGGSGIPDASWGRLESVRGWFRVSWGIWIVRLDTEGKGSYSKKETSYEIEFKQ